MSETHTTFFYCAGGRCMVSQCIHCEALFRAKAYKGNHSSDKCRTCGQPKDLCLCDDYKHLSRRNNS